MTIPDFLFLKNKQRNSEKAPERRASVLSFEREKRRADRGMVFAPQSPIGSGTTTPTNGDVSPGSAKLPMGGWSPGLLPSSGASIPTSSGTVTPLSLEATTSIRPATPLSPGLPKSSGSQTRAMNPGSLAELAARARVAVPTNSGATSPMTPGTGTRVSFEVPTGQKTAATTDAITSSQNASSSQASIDWEVQRGDYFALRSEVSMSSSSELLESAHVAEGAEDAAAPRPKPPKLGVRVWSGVKYRRTS